MIWSVRQYSIVPVLDKLPIYDVTKYQLADLFEELKLPFHSATLALLSAHSHVYTPRNLKCLGTEARQTVDKLFSWTAQPYTSHLMIVIKYGYTYPVILTFLQRAHGLQMTLYLRGVLWGLRLEELDDCKDMCTEPR